MTPHILQAATGCTQANAELYAPHLAAACDAYGITTPLRLAHFLAQLGHESGALRHVREIWGPTAAQARYEGRADLGNTQAGDGRRYCGRGLLQTTGRANYRALTARIRSRGIDGPDFEATPELLEQPQWAVMSACDYWSMRGINRLADAGDFEAVTRAVNGGLNGYADRLRRFEKAKDALAPLDEPDDFPDTQPAEPIPVPEVQELFTAPRPDQEPYTQEAPMPIPAIVGALLPAVLDFIPKLASYFPGGRVAERNVALASSVLEIAQTATQSVNAQEAVEKMAADPLAREAVSKAIDARWADLHKLGEESVGKAREFSVAQSNRMDVRTVVGALTFIEFFSLVLVILGAIGMTLLVWGEKLSQATIDSIAMLAMVGTIIAVREFWLGSSAGSRMKDQERNIKENP